MEKKGRGSADSGDSVVRIVVGAREDGETLNAAGERT